MKFIILGCGSSVGVPRPDGFLGMIQKIKLSNKMFCSY